VEVSTTNGKDIETSCAHLDDVLVESIEFDRAWLCYPPDAIRQLAIDLALNTIESRLIPNQAQAPIYVSGIYDELYSQVISHLHGFFWESYADQASAEEHIRSKRPESEYRPPPATPEKVKLAAANLGFHIANAQAENPTLLEYSRWSALRQAVWLGPEKNIREPRLTVPAPKLVRVIWMGFNTGRNPLPLPSKPYERPDL